MIHSRFRNLSSLGHIMRKECLDNMTLTWYLDEKTEIGKQIINLINKMGNKIRQLMTLGDYYIYSKK